MDTALNVLNISSKKLVHKAPEGIGGYIGNKNCRHNCEKKPVIDENSRTVEEKIIPPEKREGILNELREVL